MRIPRSLLVAALATLAPAALAGEPNEAHVGFDAGAEGWSLHGLTTITPTGGNPDERIFWNDLIDDFGMTARNSTHPAFIGDYTAKGEVSLSIDWQVNYISFFGTPAGRELVVILYDDDTFMGAPPAGVWKSLGILPGNGLPWTTFSADVTDVLSDTLPAGWNGLGDEDPQTFEPILPAGRTWTNVLQGVDRIEFTTYVPGFFFGFTNFNLSIDNVSIAPLPGNAWTDQGFALGGVAGDPGLVGEGTMAPGSGNTLTLSNAAPSAPALVVAGFSSVPLPFKGGTLVPDVQVLVPLATGPAGSLPLLFHMPASGVPSGFELWVQIAIQDAAAPNGVALSNAVVGVTP